MGERRTPFPDDVKDAAVLKYLSGNLTFKAVGAQFGADRSTVASWVRQAENRSEMKKRIKSGAATPTPTPTPTDTRSAAEKLRLLLEASGLSEEALGEFLRREGLRDGDLERYRAEAMGGLGGKIRSDADRRRIQELERANAKQGKLLREASALLELQKKVHELWGAKDEDTSES